MGNYTQFFLEVSDNGPSLDDVAGKLAETCGYPDINRWLQFITAEDDAKWYDHTLDMRNISKHWPDVLFALHGIGEENGDMWVEYHWNGKVQTETQPEWEPPAFCPQKLC